MTRLDINAATVEEIERVRGLGEKRAREIVELRERSGGIRHVEDVLTLPSFATATPEDVELVKSVFVVRPETLLPGKPRKLDLNRSNRDDLLAIVGIGEKRVDALLEHRRLNGGFRSLDEIDDLPAFRDLDALERQAIKSRLMIK